MVAGKPPDKHPLLVFGLAGRVGAGVSFVRDKLQQQLRTYGYDVEIIDVTTVFLVEMFAIPTEQTTNPDALTLFDEAHQSQAERIAELQRRGNELRHKHGNDIISKLCVGGVIGQWLAKRRDSNRVAFIIDSLKRPEEVDLLKSVFRDAFVMVAVVSSDEKRKERLQERKALSAQEFERLSSADADQHTEHGQQASAAILKADYFLANNFSTKDELDPVAGRLLRLLFNVGIESPSQDEFGMHIAYEAAARSACLSRQVGAALFSTSGDILATGCNDVPKFGGGLYGSVGADKRCWTLAAKCYNDAEKELIVEELLAVLNNVPGISDNTTTQKELRRALGNTRIRSLIEFSRAVHAEMDAMLSVARSAERGLVGATLYTTTYPCHNCAKHIIAAGIRRVVYLEPYEKSLARKLHFDSISDRQEDDKVSFDTYGGVAPRRYNDFFAMREPRKQDGKYIDRDRDRATLLHLGALRNDELADRINRIVDEVKPIIGECHETRRQNQR